MPRGYAFPAKYAPYVAITLDALKATIDADQTMSGEDSPWPHGTIAKTERPGTITILVGDLPTDAAVSAFPQVEQPARMEKAS